MKKLTPRHLFVLQMYGEDLVAMPMDDASTAAGIPRGTPYWSAYAGLVEFLHAEQITPEHFTGEQRTDPYLAWARVLANTMTRGFDDLSGQECTRLLMSAVSRSD